LVLVAAQVLTNGDFELNITDGWDTFDEQPGLGRAWDSSGVPAGTGGAAKFSTLGKRTKDVGGLSQLTPSITAGSTVTLSFYWKKDWAVAAPSPHRLYVEVIKPDLVTSVTLWEDAVVTQGGSWTAESPAIPAGTFDQTGVYEFRLGADYQNGNDNNAETHGWFDEVVLDVTGTANNPPTASAGDLTDQDDPQYAGVQYQVTAVYSDLDGAADLADLYLRLDHDTATQRHRRLGRPLPDRHADLYQDRGLSHRRRHHRHLDLHAGLGLDGVDPDRVRGPGHRRSGGGLGLGQHQHRHSLRERSGLLGHAVRDGRGQRSRRLWQRLGAGDRVAHLERTDRGLRGAGSVAG
jgi:hypothetical protein